MKRGIFIFCILLSFLIVSSSAASTINYNRIGATNYAQEHCGTGRPPDKGYNPDYWCWNSDKDCNYPGNTGKADCANFVSQALIDGGLDFSGCPGAMNIARKGKVMGIVSVKKLVSALTNGFCFKVVDPSEAEPGDVLVWKNSSHVAIYAGGKNYYAHTTDRCNSSGYWSEKSLWNNVIVLRFQDDDKCQVCKKEGKCKADLKPKCEPVGCYTCNSETGECENECNDYGFGRCRPREVCREFIGLLGEPVGVCMSYNPGGDCPDETITVGTGEQAGPVETTEGAPVAVLDNGYPYAVVEMLGEFKEDAEVVKPSDVSPDMKARVLIIPTGGLAGVDNSELFKEVLAEYVKRGGVVIVFSQQYGKEYSILPTPDGKPLSGYGWVEDQSCFYRSAYIDTWHQVLAGLTTATPNINIDGYFTEYPDSSVILLRRTANGQPAMLMYQYGSGYVIATTAYMDYGKIARQSSKDEAHLLRDIVAWAINPKVLPEVFPGAEVTFNLHIKNYDTERKATATEIEILDPDRATVVYSTKLPIELNPGQENTVTISYPGAAGGKVGIYKTRYNLLTEGIQILTSELEPSGVPVWLEYLMQPPTEEPSGRFVVSSPPENPYKSPDFSFSIQSDAEYYLYGSPATFTVIAWNNTDIDHTLEFRYYLPHLGPPGTRTFDVPANSSTSFEIVVPEVKYQGWLWGTFYDESGRPVGSARKGIWMAWSTVDISLQTDKESYAKGESVTITDFIKNKISYEYPVDVKTTVTDPSGSVVFEDTKTVELPASGTASVTNSFALPATSVLLGTYTVKIEALYNGRILSSSYKKFELPVSEIKITPTLPDSFIEGPNTISFTLKNAGLIDVNSGQLQVTFKDPEGVVLYEGSHNFSLSVGQSTNIDISVNIPQLKPGNYLLSYIQSDETKEGREIKVPIKNEISMFPRAQHVNYVPGQSIVVPVEFYNKGLFQVEGILTVDTNFSGTVDNQTVVISPGVSTVPVEIALPIDMVASGRITIRFSGSGFDISKDVPVYIRLPEINQEIVFDRYQHIRATVPVQWRLSNNGAFVGEMPAQVQFSIPAIGYQYSDNITLSPGVESTLSLNFSIPETLQAGSYEVVGRVVLPGGREFQEVETLIIPGPEPRVVLPEVSSYSAGQSIPISVENTGGVDSSYSLDVRLIGPYGEDVVNKTFTGTTQAGSTEMINITIPQAAMTGTYILKASVKDTSTERRYSVRKDIKVDGAVVSSFSVRTSKDIYLSAEPVEAMAEYSLTGALTQGEIDFEVFRYLKGGGQIRQAPYEWIQVNRWGSCSADTFRRQDDGYIEGVLPFPVTINGNVYTRYTMSSNGAIELIPEGGSFSVYSEYGYVDDVIAAHPNAFIIFASFDDLTSDAWGYYGVRYVTPGDGCGLTEEAMVFYWETETYYDYDMEYLNHFEVILYPDGRIRWNFDGMDFSGHDYDMYSGLYDGKTGQRYDVGTELADVSYEFSPEGSMVVEDLLWQKTEPLSIQSGTVQTVAGQMGVTGKLYLRGRLRNSLGQVLAEDVYPFYIEDTQFPVVLSTDKGVYRTGEVVGLTGIVQNQTSAALSGAVLRITASGSVVHEQTVDIPAGGSYSFSLSLQGLTTEETTGEIMAELLSGGSVLSSVATHYRVEKPRVVVSITTDRQAVYPAEMNWIEVSEADADGLLKEDDDYMAGVLPFTVVINGRRYTTFEMNTNGLVELIEEGGSGHGITDYGSPQDVLQSYPDASLIFASFDDLNSYTYGYIAYKAYRAGEVDSSGNVVDRDCVVFYWRSPTYDDNSPEAMNTFEVVLYKDGTIRWNFRQMDYQQYGYEMFSGVSDELGGYTVAKAAGTGQAYVFGDVVGRDGYVLMVDMENPTGMDLSVQYGLSADGQSIDTKPIVLKAGQRLTLQYQQTAEEDVLYNLSLTGDVNYSLDKVVYYGLKGRVELAGGADTVLAPEGEVEVPVRLTSTGALEGEFRLLYEVRDLSGQVLYSEERPYRLRPGDSVEDSIALALTEGQYVLSVLDPGAGVQATVNLEVERPGRGLVSIGGQDTYPEGTVVVPFEVTNTGRFGAGYEVSLRVDSEVKHSRQYFIQAGESITDELVVSLTEGQHLIEVALVGWPEGSAEKTIQVVRPLAADVALSAGQQTGGLIPLDVTMTNTGWQDIDGRIEVAVVSSDGTEVWAAGRVVSLPRGGPPSTATFEFDPSVVEPGRYTVKAALTDGAGQVLSTAETSLSIAGPVFEIVQLPGYQSFQAGQEAELTFVIKNTGDQAGQVSLTLSSYDFLDQTETLWLGPQEQRAVTFSFLLPEDIEDKDYYADYRLESELSSQGSVVLQQGTVKYHVQGVAITVTATLDKPYYREGDTAHLTLQISSQDSQQRKLFARVHYGDFEQEQHFTLSGIQSLTFDIPLTKITGEKLFYGIYHETGRSIHLNSLYIYKAGEGLIITTDKQVYEPGDTVIVEVSAQGSGLTGQMTLEGPGGYSETFSFSGTATRSFTLPAEMTAGTYTIQAELKTQDGQSITETHPIDVAGIEVKVKEAWLDRPRYSPIDTMQLSLRIESNTTMAATLKAWVVDPNNVIKELGGSAVTLNATEPVLFEGTFPLDTTVAGIHRLLYGIYDGETLLVSGSEAFDVGHGVVLGLSTDRDDYPEGIEPVFARVSLWGHGQFGLEVLVDGTTVKASTVSLDGFSSMEIDLGTQAPGVHKLEAVLRDGSLTSRKESSFRYGSALADLTLSIEARVGGIRSDVLPVVVTVFNQGGSDSAASTVALYRDGALVESKPIEALGPGELRTVEFGLGLSGYSGPLSLRAVVDPEDAVREYNEQNNEATTTVDIPAERPDFTVQAVPEHVALNQGQKTDYTVTVGAISGYDSEVSLEIEGAPEGSTVTIEPPVVMPSGEATVEVMTTGETPTGTHTMTIKGSSDGIIHSDNVTLDVSGFVPEVEPEEVSLSQGEQIELLLRTASENNYTGTVQWTARTSTDALQLSPSSGIMAVPEEVSITLTATEDAQEGDYEVVFAFTDGLVSKEALVKVNVQEAVSYVPVYVVTPGPGRDNRAMVRVTDTEGRTLVEFEAFPYHYGANALMADIQGDGVQEIVVAPGPDPKARGIIRVFDKQGNLIHEQEIFRAKHGMGLAAGDLDGDGSDEVVFLEGSGLKRHSKVAIYKWYEGQGFVFTGLEFEYKDREDDRGHKDRRCREEGDDTEKDEDDEGHHEDEHYEKRVVVATADLDGDGRAELVLLSPAGHKRQKAEVWKINTDPEGEWSLQERIFEITIRDEHVASVAGCDINGDGQDEIAIGGKKVRLLEPDATEVLTFEAFRKQYRGVYLGCIDTGGDGADEIVVGKGPRPGSRADVRVFRADGLLLKEFRALPETFRWGVKIKEGCL